MNSKHYGRVGINPFIYANRRIGTKKKGKTHECGDILITLCRYGIVKEKEKCAKQCPYYYATCYRKGRKKRKKKREKTKTNATVSLLYYVTMVL